MIMAEYREVEESEQKWYVGEEEEEEKGRARCILSEDYRALVEATAGKSRVGIDEL